ncbi:MAG: MutS family DNA mismatch repair protein, partial [Chloroflexota bacterium]
FRLETLKTDLQQQLPQWLDIWHEVEALSSLATLAYLNPSATVPTVDESVSEVFHAVEIGHPLIEDENRVTNSFTFRQVGENVIITGSNMSGKSSFLRTLGVNLSLAYAGGRVFAERMDTTIFRLYTSIRVTDSLDDGISYFYAEVRRLKGLLEAIKVEDAPPVFFLIDEIFRGTNNRERLIGSRSYIRALENSNCVGLVATHDLELVQLADGDPLIRNFHFREDVLDGRMVFDYTLREGPSPTTNALRIMRMEGLPVETETEDISR